MNLRNKIREYYRSYFNPNDLLELIKTQPFQQREFAYQTFTTNDKGKMNWKRNFLFQNIDDFCQYITQHAPRKLYFGAVYSDLDQKQSVQNATIIESNLKFDIDIDHSFQIRRFVCDCNEKEEEYAKANIKKKEICEECFKFSLEAAAFLISTLRTDFGISEAPWIYFSGSRGLHVHYPNTPFLDPLENIWNETKIRQPFMYYLNMIKREKDRNTGKYRESILHPPVSQNMVLRILNMVLLPFYLETPLEDLIQMKWYSVSKKGTKKQLSPAVASNALTGLKQRLSEKNYDYNGLFVYGRNLSHQMLKKHDFYTTKIAHECLLNNGILSRYPRYDASPTTNMEKLIKVPNSIDGSTGLLVQRIPFQSLLSFTMEDLKTIDDFV